MASHDLTLLVSSDANGDALTYAWTLTAKPSGSAATLSSSTSAKPTFTADLAGTYVATIVVNDGKVTSSAATVSITAAVANAAPVANAGVTQNVVTGSVVTLDGSASSDANSDPLTFAWTLTTKPTGSTATLVSPTSAKPTFTADVAGTYVINVVVNDGKINSSAVAVSITASVANAAPIANAGVVQSVVTGTVVTLDGSASSDANSDPLTYAWTLTAKPASSSATLSSSTSAKPTFTADVAGTYVASVTVNDGKVNSSAATVSVTAAVANAAPVAHAGIAQNVVTGAVVTLDGSASSDANNDPLTYAWTLTAKPAGSSATLASPTSVKPTFTADAAGTYVANVVVNDGKVNSNAAPVSITASRSLNDTGTSQCFQAGSDTLVACSSANAIALSNTQDGMLGRDTDATKNSSIDGNLGFSFSAVTGGCVQDNVTGLMWEVKTSDGGLRDRGMTYSGPTDASVYASNVSATNLCGFNDWRVPTIDELHSIVNYGEYIYPFIDRTWFPNTIGALHWTSSRVIGVPDYVYVGQYFGYFHMINFGNGTSNYGTINTQASVQLVRGALSSLPQARFTVSADGQEVTDSQTNLIWRRDIEDPGLYPSPSSSTSLFTHEAALQRAVAVAISSGKAWRLPNIKELASLADKNRSLPSIDTVAFPSAQSSSFWSSTPIEGVSIRVGAINFQYGVVQLGERAFLNRLRLVRNAP